MEPPVELPKSCQGVCKKLEPILNDYLIDVEKGSISYLKFYELISSLNPKEQKEALMVVEKLTVGRKPLYPNLLSYFLKRNLNRSQKLSKEPPFKIEYLLGPVSMSYHIIPESEMTGKLKKIYILGDQHDEPERTKMYSVVQFVIDLTEKFPGFIDIFLESEFLKEGPYVDYEECWLNEAWIALRDCVVKKRYLGCSYTSRIHAIDVRMRKPPRWGMVHFRKEELELSDKLSEENRNMVINRLKKEYFDKDCIKRFETFEGFLILFKQILELEKITDMRCLGEKTLKISKQLKNCSESFRELVIKWTMERVEKFRDIIKPLKSDLNGDELMDSIEGEYDILCILQDIYCLGRMFRTFPKARDPSDDFKRYHPRETENIVVYVGDYHAQHMRRFLDLLSPSKRINFPTDEDYKVVTLSGHRLFSD